MSLLVTVCLEPLPAPQRLQEVMVPVVSNQDCRTTYSILTSNMICAGLPNGGKDSCEVRPPALPYITMSAFNHGDTAQKVQE